MTLSLPFVFNLPKGLALSPWLLAQALLCSSYAFLLFPFHLSLCLWKKKIWIVYPKKKEYSNMINCNFSYRLIQRALLQCVWRIASDSNNNHRKLIRQPFISPPCKDKIQHKKVFIDLSTKLSMWWMKLRP